MNTALPSEIAPSSFGRFDSDDLELDDEGSLFGGRTPSPTPPLGSRIVTNEAAALPASQFYEPSEANGGFKIEELPADIGCHELLELLGWEQADIIVNPVDDYLSSLESLVQPIIPSFNSSGVSTFSVNPQDTSLQLGGPIEEFSFIETYNLPASAAVGFAIFPVSDSLDLPLPAANVSAGVQEAPNPTVLIDESMPTAWNYGSPCRQDGSLEANSLVIAAQEGRDPIIAFHSTGSTIETDKSADAWPVEVLGHSTCLPDEGKGGHTINGNLAGNTLPLLNQIRSPSKHQSSRPDFSVVSNSRRANLPSPLRARHSIQRSAPIPLLVPASTSCHHEVSASVSAADISPTKAGLRGAFERSRRVVEAFKVQKKLHVSEDPRLLAAIRHSTTGTQYHNSLLGTPLARRSLTTPESCGTSARQAIDLDAPLGNELPQFSIPITEGELGPLDGTQKPDPLLYMSLAPLDLILQPGVAHDHPCPEKSFSTPISNAVSITPFTSSLVTWSEFRPSPEEDLWPAVEDSQVFSGLKRTVSEALEEVMAYSLNYPASSSLDSEGRCSKRIKCS